MIFSGKKAKATLDKPNKITSTITSGPIIPISTWGFTNTNLINSTMFPGYLSSAGPWTSGDGGYLSIDKILEATEENPKEQECEEKPAEKLKRLLEF